MQSPKQKGQRTAKNCANHTYLPGDLTRMQRVVFTNAWDLVNSAASLRGAYDSLVLFRDVTAEQLDMLRTKRESLSLCWSPILHHVDLRKTIKVLERTHDSLERSCNRTLAAFTELDRGRKRWNQVADKSAPWSNKMEVWHSEESCKPIFRFTFADESVLEIPLAPDVEMV